MFKALWSYRGFVFQSVKREFLSKYRNSLLGVVWSLLNPLAMIFVYTVIFSNLMQAKLPGVTGVYAYSVFLCAGTLTWGLFAEIVGRCQNTFIDNGNLLKKMQFPRLCLPVILVLNASVNFVIVFSLFTLFLIITSNFPGVIFSAVVPLLILLILFAVSLGIIIGILNVFFRDVGQFMTIFLVFWFWLTPIVYPATILPEHIREWLKFNPVFPLFVGFQDIMVQKKWPQWESLIPLSCLTLIFAIVALQLFRRRSGELIDEL